MLSNIPTNLMKILDTKQYNFVKMNFNDINVIYNHHNAM